VAKQDLQEKELREGEKETFKTLGGGKSLVKGGRLGPKKTRRIDQATTFAKWKRSPNCREKSCKSGGERGGCLCFKKPLPAFSQWRQQMGGRNRLWRVETGDWKHKRIN